MTARSSRADSIALAIFASRKLSELSLSNLSRRSHRGLNFPSWREAEKWTLQLAKSRARSAQNQALGMIAEQFPHDESLLPRHAELCAREQLYRNIAAERSANRKFPGGWLNRNNAREFVTGPQDQTQTA